MGDKGEEEERRQEDMFPGCPEAGARSTNQPEWCIVRATSDIKRVAYSNTCMPLENSRIQDRYNVLGSK